METLGLSTLVVADEILPMFAVLSFALGGRFMVGT